MENLMLTEFDIATSGTYLQMIKAYLPFTGLKEQRILSLVIRIVELMQTVSFYNNLSEPSPLFRSNHDKDNIIREIRKFCPGKDFEILDMINNLSNMNDIMSMFNETNFTQNQDESAKNPDIMKKFLSKEQQNLYESYKKILNS